MIPSPRRPDRGYILAVTVWILAVVTLGAAYFADRVARSIQLAQQTRDATEALIDLAGTRAELQFRLATTHFGFFGAGPTPAGAIALDDRPYRGSGQSIARLQDARGLVNVNFPQPEILLRLLGQHGVPADRWPALLDALRDYTDIDDLRHLNGAEAAEYRALDLPPPANDWLVSPHQLQGIVGWRDLAPLWQDERFIELATTARITGFNPNTAPREVLLALPFATPEAVDRLLQLRRQRPLFHETDLLALLGRLPLDSDSLVFFPGNTLRLTLEDPRLPWKLRYHLTLTPFSDPAPWRIDYHNRAGVPSPAQHATPPLPLPALDPAPLPLPNPADPAL